ncbi:MAG: hypothetical protein E7049_07175 [Lentisphaerae bacterium]|jgi:hypothetical protein|nr:hypothetical protein [Lentisphaerota bacterium]
MKKTVMMKLLATAAIASSTITAFAARPVARWDVVPYQRVAGQFKMGVVAFHEKGVQVEFTINGRDTYTADKPTMNDRVGVYEYVLPLETSRYEDGPIAISATVTTEGEPPTRLPYLQLYVNNKKTQGSQKVVWVDSTNGNEFSDGTKQSPVQSIKRGIALAGDGGTLYLMPGEYSAKMLGGGTERKFWTTVQPAPGHRRSEIKIKGGRTGTEKLRFHLVELYCDISEGFGKIIMGEGGSTMGWFDGCKMYNRQGRWSGETEPFGNKLRAFVTGGETSAMTKGPDAELIRGHVLKSLAGNAFFGSDRLIVACRAIDIDAGETSQEADFYRGTAFAPNWIHGVILYNVSCLDCKARAISGIRMRDSAFINVTVRTSAGSLVHSYFSDMLDNLLFRNLKIEGQDWVWMQGNDGRAAVIARDVRFLGCSIPQMSGFEPLDGSHGILVTE